MSVYGDESIRVRLCERVDIITNRPKCVCKIVTCAGFI